MFPAGATVSAASRCHLLFDRLQQRWATNTVRQFRTWLTNSAATGPQTIRQQSAIRSGIVNTTRRRITATVCHSVVTHQSVVSNARRRTTIVQKSHDGSTCLAQFTIGRRPRTIGMGRRRFQWLSDYTQFGRTIEHLGTDQSDAVARSGGHKGSRSSFARTKSGKTDHWSR